MAEPAIARSDTVNPRDDVPAPFTVDAAEKRRLLNRLKRLEGQVRGLQRMIDEERPCKDILTLLSGVRSALDATGDEVLAAYLRRCQADFAQGEGDVGDLLAAVRLARG